MAPKRLALRRMPENSDICYAPHGRDGARPGRGNGNWTSSYSMGLGAAGRPGDRDYQGNMIIRMGHDHSLTQIFPDHALHPYGLLNGPRLE
ncbi:hypothetical protein NDU88_004889 [Pleurodeles waltl]|uniref:Uncharacterized protein n=1 Tax=Pleurodeles waltl TaxID=8319 RepID=A0AAV7QGN9_PLEWA|nr:hypothetical protein NDU88_004889 [Pleurodeles waltl]